MRKHLQWLEAFARGLLVIAPLAAIQIPAAMAAGLEGIIDLESGRDEAIFTYKGPAGPEHWGMLRDDWALCSEGTQQSPVDFDALAAVPEQVSDLSFDYRPSVVRMRNNGHSVVTEYMPGSFMMLDGMTWQLVQFHYHTPSEHSLQGGARYIVEQHLVHRNQDGDLAVVGVMVREGERNPALPGGRRLDQLLPKADGVLVEFPDEFVNASGLLPSSLESFRYSGSLTTPPCSENVRWVVMAEPIEISPAQMRALLNTLGILKHGSTTGTNNRPTQPLNDRAVRLDSGN